MRKSLIVVAAAAALVVGGIVVMAQPYGPGWMMGPGGPGGYGPGWMMGPGGPDGPGGYGPGWMMGNGYGPGWMHRYGPGYYANQRDLSLSVDDVKTYMTRMVQNPNLKVGEVKEKDADTITADIVTKDKDVLVQRLVINRHSGFMQPEQ